MPDPMRVEVVCPNCTTGTILGGPCAFCQGFALSLPAIPGSLTEAKLRLAEAAVKKGMYVKPPEWDFTPDQQEWNERVAAVRNHPDYKAGE